MSLDRGPSKDIERKVFDAEIVDDEAVPPPSKELVRRVIVTPVTRVVRDDRTRYVAARATRHAYAVVQGFGSWGKRALDASTMRVYRRQVRAAELAGDRQALGEWMDRQEAALAARHKRRMDMPKAVRGYVKTALLVFVVVVVVVLAAGVVAELSGGRFGAVVMGVIDTVSWVFRIVAWAWTPLLVVTPFVLVIAAWHEGQKRGTMPSWARTPEERRREMVNLTPAAVVVALRDLGITPLRKAIKDDPDNGARMLGQVGRFGPGWQVDVSLPPQVTAQDIMKRRETLAGNLDRKKHEIDIECGPDSERVFTLWVADSGALDQQVPPSPLLDEEFGPVDIYRDLMPWGIGLKGDPIELQLLQVHFLLAGLSKQGKTAAARALILWFALDPSVKIRVADLKGFGDWSMFEGLAEVLIEGAGAENFIATCDMLEDAVAEMQRRYERWRAMGRKGDIDRASSLPGSGFEPMVVVIDEVQKLYTCTTEHPDGGEIGGNGKKSRAARAAQALHDQARAVNIHLFQFAQNPTDRNLPVVVREGAMIRAALFVGTESIAKMALGEAPVDTGAAPHALRMGLDRGTVVLAPGEAMDLPGGVTHTTVRTHYISTKQSYDIAERAKRLRMHRVERLDEERDLLADVREVLAGEDERAAQVARRLQDLSPAYEGLSGAALGERLTEEFDVPVKALKGYPTVRAEDVDAAIMRRETEGAGADSDG